MQLKYPPALAAVVDVVARWVLYSLILAWAGVLIVSIILYARS